MMITIYSRMFALFLNKVRNNQLSTTKHLFSSHPYSHSLWSVFFNYKSYCMSKDLNLELRNETPESLKDFFKLLKSIQVEYFGCRDFYPDGSSIDFCSQEKWYEVEMDDNFQSDMAFHYAIEISFLKGKQI